uniref:Uncharacterized protein n=1 Tax=Acrobeloides nanus TaxID=290746 RepID=A0A914CE78_9BILA
MPAVETAIYMPAVETTTYTPTEVISTITETEVISTITQTKVNSKYECPGYTYFVIASEEVTYIYYFYHVYIIQNQRVVKKVYQVEFFVPWNSSYISMEAGYIRNGSLILLDDKKQ